MVESTLIVWKDLSSSPMSIIGVLVDLFYFKTIHGRVGWKHDGKCVWIDMKH